MKPPAAAPPLSAQKVCERFRPSPEARALLGPSLPPSDFVRLLMDHGLYKDALSFVACCLPKREAVWWGCLCCWHALGNHLDGKETQALSILVRWVIDPKDEHRKAAAEVGATIGGTATPVGALAAATGWSAGSMSPPGLPEVKPPEFLTQEVVGAAVLAVATRAQPADPGGACRHFLALASDVANGRNRWQASA